MRSTLFRPLSRGSEMPYADNDRNKTYMAEYRRRPEAKARAAARNRERSKDPEYKAWRREHMRNRASDPNDALSPQGRREYYAKCMADPVKYALKLAYRRKYSGKPRPTRPETTHCECCGGLPNGLGTMNLDHDHKTGKFRGWLCSRCNIAIGQLARRCLAKEGAALPCPAPPTYCSW